MHPYQIAQTLRSRAKEESVRLNYGSLYAVVASLEKQGFIRARAAARQGRRPERTVYEITDRGAREANDWLLELIAVPAKEFPQLMAGLSFLAGLPPKEALTALRERVRALELRLTALRGVLQEAPQTGSPRLFGIEGQYEVAVVAAELEFVTRLAEAIEEGSLDGLDMWAGFYEIEETRQRVAASLEELSSTEHDAS